jgi:PPE-repeat protein
MENGAAAMTAVLDFGALPPEINSGRMYAGLGSASMRIAAANWGELGGELRSHAASYETAVSGLAGQGWRGAASSAMAAAAAPYVVWMNTTAAQAEQTADQAAAAASAYEAAFAMTVPPHVVAANRTLLATLVATNTFGQNAPAIAATEANYSEMWAQDAAAMYGYAGQSAAATIMPSFTAPPETTNSDGQTKQAAAVAQASSAPATTETQATLSQAATSVPTTLQSMSSPAAASSSDSSGSSLASILNPNSNFWNTVTSSGSFNPSQIVTACTASTLGATGSTGLADSAGLDGFATLASSYSVGAQGLPSVPGIAGAGSSMSAGLGQASLVGHLSAPPAWTATAPPVSSLGPTLATSPLSTPTQAAAGMPGIAPATLAGRPTFGAALPDNRFLARPPMVPHWGSTG